MFVDPAVAQVSQETQRKHEDPADDDHYGEGIPYLEQVDLLTQEDGVFEDGEEEADQNEESVPDQEVAQLDLAGVDRAGKIKGETKQEKDVGGQKYGNVVPGLLGLVKHKLPVELDDHQRKDGEKVHHGT